MNIHAKFVCKSMNNAHSFTELSDHSQSCPIEKDRKNGIYCESDYCFLEIRPIFVRNKTSTFYQCCFSGPTFRHSNAIDAIVSWVEWKSKNIIAITADECLCIGLCASGRANECADNALNKYNHMLLLLWMLYVVMPFSWRSWACVCVSLVRVWVVTHTF